ncbi:MAG: hypothetical protein LBR85_05420 [Oscillospiraceae bacterium]|jgi:beta-lactamase regulating signal transducer with metallopeptidase domain|nr:hypothetical protein [Oscillospiraceae bacterium]
MIVWLFDVSVFMLLVIAFRAVFYRTITARARYCVWILVFVRLAVPLSSFENPLNILSVASPATVSASEDSRQDVTVSFYVDEPSEVTKPNTQSAPAAAEQPSQAQTNAQRTFPLNAILIAVWAAGSVVSFLWYFAANWRLRKKLRQSMTRHGVNQCQLPVYVSSALPSPCLYGFFRPSVILTPEVADDQQKKYYAIEHELCHYTHKDHWWALMRILTLTVFWFHPLVWVCAVLSVRDAETACDEGVIRRIGDESRFEYGRFLIELSTNVPAKRFALLQSQNSGGNLKKRVAAVARKPRNRVIFIAALSLLLIVALVCTLGTWVSPPEAQALIEGTPTEEVTPSVPQPPENSALPDNKEEPDAPNETDPNSSSGGISVSVRESDNEDSNSEEERITTITVTLENGSENRFAYSGNWDARFVSEDLFRDGSTALIIRLRNKTSNYNSSQIHVLKTDGFSIGEVFTVLDHPTGRYDDSIFYVPQPADSFGYPKQGYDDDYNSYGMSERSSHCTGVQIVQIEVGGEKINALMIDHTTKVFAYSIVYFDGSEWKVFKQGSDVYTLDLIADKEGGAIESSMPIAHFPDIEGTKVTIQAKANPGFRFSHWTSSGGGTFSDTEAPTTVFIMPGNNTVVTAHFKREV